MEEVVGEATKIDSDLGKKQRRPRVILTSIITREDTDSEPLSAECREEHKAGIKGDQVAAILDGRKDEDRFKKLQEQMEQSTSIVSGTKRKREDKAISYIQLKTDQHVEGQRGPTMNFLLIGTSSGRSSAHSADGATIQRKFVAIKNSGKDFAANTVDT